MPPCTLHLENGKHVVAELRMIALQHVAILLSMSHMSEWIPRNLWTEFRHLHRRRQIGTPLRLRQQVTFCPPPLYRPYVYERHVPGHESRPFPHYQMSPVLTHMDTKVYITSPDWANLDSPFTSSSLYVWLDCHDRRRVNFHTILEMINALCPFEYIDEDSFIVDGDKISMSCYIPKIVIERPLFFRVITAYGGIEVMQDEVARLHQRVFCSTYDIQEELPRGGRTLRA